jgi:hypothetical protein
MGAAWRPGFGLAKLFVGRAFNDRSGWAKMRLRVRIAWLGGMERFLGTDARIRFHAASNPGSDGERAVIRYLTKTGLSYEAIIYIAQAAPNEVGWLNMSDPAQRGIRVTLLSSLAKETAVVIPTRYGDIIMTRDSPECCNGHTRYLDQRIEIESAGPIYASLEGIYKVSEGDPGVQ